MGLEAHEVVVRFGGLVALDRVSIQAPSGAITGLIGPNGAGKTTLFNVCCGYLSPQAGTIRLNSEDVTRLSAVARARAGFGRTFQRLELFWSMTVRENIEIAIEARSVTDNPLSVLGVSGRSLRQPAVIRRLTDQLLEDVGLSMQSEFAAGQLTTGQGRLLELARCLARAPQFLLLDEPSAGLDARETAVLGDLICSLAGENGLGVLLVEHDMSLVLRICNEITVLDFGKELFHGSAEEVRNSPVVQAAYLGEAELTPFSTEIEG